MSTKSSAGTIPEGLHLYSFEYPNQIDFIGRPESIFFASPEEALIFAKREGAISIIHVLSGYKVTCFS